MEKLLHAAEGYMSVLEDQINEFHMAVLEMDNYFDGDRSRNYADIYSNLVTSAANMDILVNDFIEMGIIRRDDFEMAKSVKKDKAEFLWKKYKKDMYESRETYKQLNKKGE